MAVSCQWPPPGLAAAEFLSCFPSLLPACVSPPPRAHEPSHDLGVRLELGHQMKGSEKAPGSPTQLCLWHHLLGWVPFPLERWDLPSLLLPLQQDWGVTVETWVFPCEHRNVRRWGHHLGEGAVFLPSLRGVGAGDTKGQP